MLKINYATLCLLITYHWHGSWAISTWPSERPGIAAEVNGSPTDAPLNIPVVKRSSNQADLANELPLPRRPVVIVDDSPGKLVKFPAIGLFEPTHREYANRRMEKSTEPMFRSSKTKNPMIERTPDHSYETMTAKWNAKRGSMKKLIARNVAKEIRNSKVGIKALIPSEDVAPIERVVEGQNPRVVIASSGSSDELALGWIGSASIAQKRRRLDDEIRDSISGDVTEMTRTEEKSGNTIVNNGMINSGSAINGTGAFHVLGRRNLDSIVLSRIKREASLVDIVKIHSAGREVRRHRRNDERTLVNYKNVRLPGRTSLLSASKSLKRLIVYDERNKRSVASSGITSFLDVTKLRDSTRLHQQSRNTKPRTIVQHLLADHESRRTPRYDDFPMLSRINESYETKIRQAERRYPGKMLTEDRRKRRQPTNQKISNFVKFNENPNQLRFIPFYNYNDKNLGYFKPEKSSDDIINEVVTLSDNGVLTSRNIANLPSFDEAQIENLSKSLVNVFDRQLNVKRKNNYPNVKAILPKRVFVAPPRLIYDTKILPAPFSLNTYFQNSAGNVSGYEDNPVDRGNLKKSGLPLNGLFDRKKIEANLKKRPTVPRSEDPGDSVTSTKNFVTPVPMRPGQVSFLVNQPEIPLVSAFPDTAYRVRGFGMMEKPTRIREDETLQRDGDETSVNHESTSETSVKDHSSDARTSYDNSGSTYESEDEDGSRNVDHLTVPDAVNDEYANHQTIRSDDNDDDDNNDDDDDDNGDNDDNDDDDIVESDVRTTMQMPRRQGGENSDRSIKDWKREYDNDRTRYVAKYSFGYVVNDDDTQNDFGHREMRDEGVTRGRYHVRLPDGRIQNVNYHVDENGYHAAVSYRQDDGN